MMLSLIRNAALAATVLVAGPALSTDVSRLPISSVGNAKPNVIYGLDDSGSMDSELLLNSREGMFWYDPSTGLQVGIGGLLSVGVNLNISSNARPFLYLFPNGCSTSGRKHLCGTSGYAIPPTPQFAYTRSSDYNALYYDPMKTYTPWPTATVGGATRSFTNASSTAALSHPLFTARFNLIANLRDSDGYVGGGDDYQFTFMPGMRIPASENTFLNLGLILECSSVSVIPGTEVTAGRTCTIPVRYYPATYWNKASCNPTTSPDTCAVGPDGQTLRRYEIKTGVTFPSGRTYAAELQNFANWFQYYRKRKLMTAASMGNSLKDLTGIRVGVVNFNDREPPVIRDFDDGIAARQQAMGIFYSNPAQGGTPTRETLNYIGNQFMTNSSIVNYSCQKNHAVIVTDGYSGVTAVAPPAYNRATYGAGAPFATTHPGTLADIALGYYTTNIRPTLPTGRVPVSAEPGVLADRNSNLHMNTHAISLGAQGQLWPLYTDPLAQPLTWVNPTVAGSPDTIDDLWHATINGRGQMIRAVSQQDFQTGVSQLYNNILSLGSFRSATTTSSTNLTEGAKAFSGIYNIQAWTGDLIANNIDPSSGDISSSQLWSAAKLLDARTTSRKIGSFNGSSGVAFTAAAVGNLVNPSGALGNTTSLMTYLRGDRSLEGSIWRARASLMGPVISSEPVTVEDTVFVAANNGMVQAFNVNTGEELWAYVPGKALSAMGQSAVLGWQPKTILDGALTTGKVDSKSVLLGTLGSGGSGVFALDISNPAAANDAAVAAKVMWEFPTAAHASNFGVAQGKPILARVNGQGHVVLVTSGYNPTGDGRPRLFMLNASTGAVIKEYVLPEGTAAFGIAGASALKEADGFSRYAYAGDERGNLWRFDLTGTEVFKLAQLTDATGASQPITAAPELVSTEGKRIVYVGTGRILGMTDIPASSVFQSFYAIVDGPAITGPARASLARRTVVGSPPTVAGTALAAAQRGWFVDLGANEKVTNQATLARGILAFTSNQITEAECSNKSRLYLVDALTGLPSDADEAVSVTDYLTTLSSRPVVARLPDGRLTIYTRSSDGATQKKVITPTSAKVFKKRALLTIQR